jgi:hypothetical protein
MMHPLLLLAAFQEAGSPAPDAGAADAAGAAAAAGGMVGGIIGFVIWLAVIAGMWKIFTKAGEPGWAAIVPIYNLIVLLKITGKPVWWFVLLLIPCANFVVLILLMIALSKKFGGGTGTTVGLILLPMVFIPMLGLGSAQYNASA